MNIKAEFVIILLLSLLSTTARSADADNLWMQVNGKWEVNTNLKVCSDVYGKIYQFGYSEIINTSSIASIVPVKDVDIIYSTFAMTNPTDSGHAMIFFAGATHQKFYGFKFIGNKDIIQQIQFIQSDKIDATKPPSVKNNFKITVLSSENVKLQYGSALSIMILIKGKSATLSVNRNKIMSVTAPDNLENGLFGFSHKNNTITISQFKIMADDEILFEDDFSRDRIKRYTATIKKEK
jgi:hypothetical protein